MPVSTLISVVCVPQRIGAPRSAVKKSVRVLNIFTEIVITEVNIVAARRLNVAMICSTGRLRYIPWWTAAISSTGR